MFGSLTTETETPNPVSRHSNPLYFENYEGREIDSAFVLDIFDGWFPGSSFLPSHVRRGLSPPTTIE